MSSLVIVYLLPMKIAEEIGIQFEVKYGTR
jgi:hypothetical protein